MITTLITTIISICTVPQLNSTTIVTFHRKLKPSTTPHGQHLPSIPNPALHAAVTNESVVLTFDNDTYTNIDVALACGSTLIFYNHYAHEKGEPITLPLTVLNNDEDYTITIKKGDIEYVANFSLDDSADN